MTDTNTSGADVDPLAVLNDRITDRRFALSAAIGVHGMSVAAEELRKAIAARTAVAALIAERDVLRASYDDANRRATAEQEAKVRALFERDALAAEVKALRDVGEGVA